jgi:hypothetical protein
LAGAQVGGPVGDQGRQEFAAGLSLQWAALLRGDAGVKLSEGGVEQHAVPPLQSTAGGDVGPQSPPLDSTDPGASPGGVSALSDKVERQVSRQVGQAFEAALVGRLGLDNAGHRAVLDVALQALPPAIKANGEGAMVEGGTPGAPHEITPVDDKAGTPLTPVPALVTWHLSPQLAVITASQPVASDESLRVFAAAQGFDAQALNRMFGVDVAAATQPDAKAGAKEWQGLPVVHNRWSIEPTMPGAHAVSGSLSGLADIAVPADLTHPSGLGAPLFIGAAGAAESFLGRAAFGKDQVVGVGLAEAQKLVGASVGAKRDSNGDQSSLSVAKIGSTLSAVHAAFREDGGRLEAMHSSLGSMGRTGDGTASAGGVVTTAPAGIAAWWALHARGALGEAGLARVGAGAALPGAALSDPMPEVLSGPGSVSSSAAAVVASPIVETPAPIQKGEAPERPVDSQPLDLREHLDQGHEALSKRMGEALAARLLAQIDKGEWQIRLSVNPQHLGPIDIDLQMQGQRMEAQFQVAHGQTQALIQDSLPRLREAVGASGMDLASVWVSGGWSDRHRGNPTPGQPENPAALASNDGAGDEQTVGATAQVDPNRPEWTGRPGALDVLI